jgi:hypothetical protein
MLGEMQKGNKYLHERYQNEPIAQEVAACYQDENFVDDRLYAAAAKIKNEF